MFSSVRGSNGFLSGPSSRDRSGRCDQLRAPGLAATLDQRDGTEATRVLHEHLRPVSRVIAAFPPA